MERGWAGSFVGFSVALGTSGLGEVGLLTRAGIGVAAAGRTGLTGIPSSSGWSAIFVSLRVLAGRNIKVRKARIPL